MNDSPGQPPVPDPLDALLARARWPEPTAAMEHQAIAKWDRLSPARQRVAGRLIVWGAVSVAALVMVTIGLNRVLRHPPAPGKHEFVQQPAEHPTTRPEVIAVVAAPAPALVSRPADAYERMMLASTRPARAPVKARREPEQLLLAVAPPRVVMLTATEREIIRRVSLSHDTVYRRRVLTGLLAGADPPKLEMFLSLLLVRGCREDALAALRDAPAGPTAARLMAQFDDARIDYRFAAARALGEVCRSPVRDGLERMVRDNNHRREALAALLFCGHGESFLAAARADRSIDAQLRSVKGEIHRLF